MQVNEAEALARVRLVSKAASTVRGGICAPPPRRNLKLPSPSPSPKESVDQDKSCRLHVTRSGLKPLRQSRLHEDIVRHAECAVVSGLEPEQPKADGVQTFNQLELRRIVIWLPTSDNQ